MDTIVLCKMFHSSDKLSKSYNLLPSHSPVIGYSTWITNVKNLDQSCAWIKINCHELLRVQNVSKDDIETLTKFLDRQLIKIGLSRHDFNINRIDYDYNVVVSKAKRKALLEILDGLPKRAMRMKKEDFPPSVYYMCKARHFQIYDKGLERIDKGKYIRPWEVDVLRQEVQCHSDHIRYKAKCGLQSTWDNWVNLDLQAYYLKNAKPIFPKGNFYSLNQALEIVSSSGFNSAKKKHLCKDLVLVSIGGLDALKEFYSPNTYKNHLACFEKLGVSPLTLPSKYKHLGKIKNPFFK